MPLPTSGLITMDQICTEFKIPVTSDLGCDALRKAANKLTGDISMSDFYGLSNLKFIVHKFKLTLGASDDYAWDHNFNNIGFSGSLGKGAISPASINVKGINVPITDISFGVYG
uniref:hypothetical protein n=1 Tax=Aeromonas lacus TaxID=558884 RepID=UPI00126A3478